MSQSKNQRPETCRGCGRPLSPKRLYFSAWCVTCRRRGGPPKGATKAATRVAAVTVAAVAVSEPDLDGDVGVDPDDEQEPYLPTPDEIVAEARRLREERLARMRGER